MGKAKRENGGAMKQQELERRLATAYDAGYYDGYTAGVIVTHDIWVNIAEKTNGVGPKIQQGLLETARREMATIHDENFGKPTQDVEDVRAEINNVTEG